MAGEGETLVVGWATSGGADGGEEAATLGNDEEAGNASIIELTLGS